MGTPRSSASPSGEGAPRQLESDAYRAARERGRPLLREFGHCPTTKPASLVDRARGVVGLVTGRALSDNANVAVLPVGDGRVLCLSETTRSSAVIDPCTLATIGKFRYGDALGGVIQAGHPGRDRLRVLDAAPRPLSGQATVS